MEILGEVLIDAAFDCIKMLPFLFVAFVLIEVLEHYSDEMTTKMLQKVGKAGPIVGAIAGCVPQCGFSVMASNLYAGGIVSLGTLLSVFIATSDEAAIIIMGYPEYIGKLGVILVVKLVVAILAGYMADLLLKRFVVVEKGNGDLCDHCGCHEEQAGVLLPAWRHTVKIFVYLFIVSAVLNLVIEVFGMEKMSAMLLGNTMFQPVIAAFIGLIPNCAASVILTQLYLNDAISFASVISGLCTGAGVGLIVLCKMNRNKKENIKIIVILLTVAIAVGILLESMGIFV